MYSNDLNLENIQVEIQETLKLEGYTSYDLCDIKALPWYLWLYKSFYNKSYGKYLIFPFQLVTGLFPGIVRSLFGIKKASYPQATALVCRSLILQYKKEAKPELEETVKSLLDKIEKGKSKQSSYSSWGQPYNWFSGMIIPKDTPRTTVTSQMIDTFLDAYLAFNDDKYKAVVVSACNFFLEEMKVSYEDEDGLCFSYTMIDSKKVYNANMMAASALIRAGTKLKNRTYIDKGLKCLQFVVNGQNQDGSWYYYHFNDNRSSRIDNYHTGYVLEGLCIVKQVLGVDFSYDKELELGIQYFKKALFTEDWIPKITDDKLYPIDIQCCAQAIITFTELSSLDTTNLELADKILKYTQDNLYRNGHYYYRLYKNRTDKNPYIRWGDSWMLYGISLMRNQK